MRPRRTCTGPLAASSRRASPGGPPAPYARCSRPRRQKTFCEFFAGIGLVREGLRLSGWNCAYANDIDPAKRRMYEARFGRSEEFHLCDVWNTPEVLSRIQGSPLLATASFPCVDLSVAGGGRGLRGAHSSAFFGFVETLRSLAERRPALVLLENVPGFITSGNGNDFATAMHALANLGYWLDAFVLDARCFVPQSRPRIFVVGLHRGELSAMAAPHLAPEDFVERWHRALDRQSLALRPRKLFRLMHTVSLPTGWMALDLPMPTPRRKTLADVIDVDDMQAWWDAGTVTRHREMMSDLHRNRTDQLRAQGGMHIATMYRRTRNHTARAELRTDGLAGCLRTPRGGSARQIVVVVDEGQVRMRWMSPREYARLQGADDFPLCENTNQNLYGFGDAVCVPVITWIDRHVLTPLADSLMTQSRISHAAA